MAMKPKTRAAAKKKPPMFKTCAGCPTPAKCKKAGKCLNKKKK